MAFRWRDNGGPLLVVFGSSIPSSTKNKNKIKMLDPFWPNLDPPMNQNELIGAWLCTYEEYGIRMFYSKTCLTWRVKVLQNAAIWLALSNNWSSNKFLVFVLICRLRQVLLYLLNALWSYFSLPLLVCCCYYAAIPWSYFFVICIAEQDYSVILHSV